MTSIDEQIAEVEREINMRQRVYPHQVMAKKMSQGTADRHLNLMRDVLASLKRIRNGQPRHSEDPD